MEIHVIMVNVIMYLLIINIHVQDLVQVIPNTQLKHNNQYKVNNVQIVKLMVIILKIMLVVQLHVQLVIEIIRIIRAMQVVLLHHL